MNTGLLDGCRPTALFSLWSLASCEQVETSLHVAPKMIFRGISWYFILCIIYIYMCIWECVLRDSKLCFSWPTSIWNQIKSSELTTETSLQAWLREHGNDEGAWALMIRPGFNLHKTRLSMGFHKYSLCYWYSLDLKFPNNNKLVSNCSVSQNLKRQRNIDVTAHKLLRGITSRKQVGVVSQQNLEV